MGTLPSLLRRFYFIFKEQRDKSKKDSPSQPAPAPASPFQTRLIPFPLPWLSSSASSSPLVTACLNFLISVPSCEDNSVWRECFHRLQQSRAEEWRDVMRQSASSKFNYIVPHLTSPHLTMTPSWTWILHSAGIWIDLREIYFILFKRVLFFHLLSNS